MQIIPHLVYHLVYLCFHHLVLFESSRPLNRLANSIKSPEDDLTQVQNFGEKLTSSGIVLNDDIVWISFHSGYDFG